ncbi:MAG: CPBP family intramembrane glutamic endopeptidase, partial [Pyrinomonadaceae bacterium]
MKTLHIFFGSDGKLRSGWRFAIFCFLYFAASYFLFEVGTVAVFSTAYGKSISALTSFVISSLVGFIPAILIGWLCGKLFEHLPFRALGAWFTEGWLTHLLFGIFIGILTLVIAVAIGANFGNLDFSINATDSAAIAQTLLASLLVFGLGAAFEEALFRGYVLQTFVRAGLAWPAIILTSIFFGVVHLNNPNAGYLSSINTALAGIWFGVAYLKTRDLWFVWGLHLMWNWTQGAIFGIEVSGLTDIVHSPLLKETDHGPAWLTGESYGIEASVACTIALIVS